MKHILPITLIIIALFFSAQLIGLGITNKYLEKDLPYGIERPHIPEKTAPFSILAFVIMATLLVLVLAHFKSEFLWKLWFFLAVVFALSIAFSVFVPEIPALFIAIGLALMKVFRTNVYTHNLTELFIYGGLAAIFVPVLSVFSMIILLLLISAYDMYAVWKSKYMIKLAQFQTKLKVFAGIFIPYENKKAILGGGDIGFPLLFAGVVMKESNIFNGLIIALATTLSLFLLFKYSKKGRFYPAMPYITVGCLVSYYITLLL